MNKYCLYVENNRNLKIKVGFSDRTFFLKISSLVDDESMKYLKENFPDIPIIGGGSVSDDFKPLEFDTEDGIKTFEKMFKDKYNGIKTIIKESRP